MQHKDSSLAHNSGSLGHKSTTLRHNSTSLRHNSGGVQALSDSLPLIFFHQPSLTNGAGYDAVSGTEKFTLNRAAVGGDFQTGPRGQELLRMGTTDVLDANANAFTGTPLEELKDTDQFFVLGVTKPNGSTATNQRMFQTATGANAGIRMSFSNSVGGIASGVQIRDATTGVTITPPIDALHADWDNNDCNAMLAIFDIAGGNMDVWINNRTQRTTSFQRKDISALSFGAGLANTIPAQIDAEGDLMVLVGQGVPTDDQAERLLQFGAGLTYAEYTGETANYLISARCNPGQTNVSGANPTLQIVGCATKAPIINIHADSSRTEHGAAVATTTTPVTLDSQGWFSHLFDSGLSNDTTYWIEFEYDNGVIDRRRMRQKTLPASIDGLKFGVCGCWEWDTLIDNNDAISVEFMERTFMRSAYNSGLDFVTHTGDDFYYDYVAVDLSMSVPIDDVNDFQTVHADVAGKTKVNQFMMRMPMVPGIFSDHDFLENDVFGADATAAQIAAAKAHWTQRTGLTFPLSGNMYHSDRIYFNDTSITFIRLDMRTEAEAGVQLTSTAQRAQMQTDATTAVGNGDLIILYSEYAFDEGESPSPPGSWNRFTSERTDVFDRLVTAGVTNDKLIVLYGDQHAGGVDIAGVSQGGFDTGGILQPIGILASRANSPNAGSSAGATTHPDYFDSGNQHMMHVEIAVNLTQLDVTVTPVEQATVKTAIGPRTIG